MLGTRLTLQLAVLCAVCTSPVYAQSDEHESSEHESASGHDSAHGAHKNVVSFFAGVTHAGRRKNGAALGVGYERLLNESFGIGVFAEHTFGDAETAEATRRALGMLKTEGLLPV